MSPSYLEDLLEENSEVNLTSSVNKFQEIYQRVWIYHQGLTVEDQKCLEQEIPGYELFPIEKCLKLSGYEDITNVPENFKPIVQIHLDRIKSLKENQDHE
jgi:hypothetical protein